jgi:hypothetical protein
MKQSWCEDAGADLVRVGAEMQLRALRTVGVVAGVVVATCLGSSFLVYFGFRDWRRCLERELLHRRRPRESRASEQCETRAT